jgi:hypothetical protein
LPEIAVGCRVAAQATLRASAELIVQLRRQPCAIGGDALPAALLKHSEDQTVVAFTTVARALSRAGWEGRSFADWGVVAAPNFFGRIGIAQTLQRFIEEGAWGISPHLIPHQSLHAMSGTISQALKIYGPNFGISGGPNAGPDAFLLAATLLTDVRLPGLWLILTGYEQEYIPTVNGQGTSTPPPCAGVALALTRPEPGESGLTLRVGPGPYPNEVSLPEFQLTELVEELSRTGPQAARWRLGTMGWIELESSAASEGSSR